MGVDRRWGVRSSRGAVSRVIPGRSIGRRSGDLPVSVLLDRAASVEHGEAARSLVRGRRILVTGAAGSIGSEIAIQAADMGGEVYLLDLDESRLHSVKLRLTGDGLLDDDVVVLADIRDRVRLLRAFEAVRPEIVFHAAAHKHLPLLQRYPSEGVKTNVRGTEHVVAAAESVGVERMILVSTDKAADPTSVLGTTKWLAECITEDAARTGSTRMASVRFGNVLGSRGSFLDTLRHQVDRGLPVTVTDPEVTRYFMTIPEAVSLVIEAAVLAEAGETYVLDMGEPMRIVELVHRYAALLGHKRPEVRFTGLRPGEKRDEILFSMGEVREQTANPRIWRTGTRVLPPLGPELAGLYRAADEANEANVADLLARLASAVPSV